MEENTNCTSIEFTDDELEQIMAYQRIIEAAPFRKSSWRDWFDARSDRRRQATRHNKKGPVNNND